MGILTQIRRQPDNQKKFFSLITAFILTLVIVGFWLSFNYNSSTDQTADVSQDKLSSLSPLQVIKDEFSKAFAGFDGNASDTANSLLPVEVVPVDTSSSTDSTITATSTATTTNQSLSTSTATTTKTKISKTTASTTSTSTSSR